LEKALEFFEEVVGRPASPAEQTGDISLPILIALIDARFPIAAEQAEAAWNAKRDAEIAAERAAAQKPAGNGDPSEPGNSSAASPEVTSA
jgi:hypothetical protein